MRLHCFFTVNSSVNAVGLCGVVVRCSRVESKVPGLNPTELFIPTFFFFPFFVLLFSINI